MRKGAKVLAINQYAKEGNGPNAHKKGNRTKSKRNTGPAVEISKQISKDIEHYREIAESFRKARTWTQEELTDVYERLNKHIDEADEDENPLTIGGMILASGMSRDSWYKAVGGEYDYRLYEYIELHNIDITKAHRNPEGIPCIVDDENRVVMLIPWSDVLQKALLVKEARDERRLLKKGRVADIFNLKALHGWQEENSPQTVNQTLVIASPEQAREAINLLK
jgi:hypothetical protein